MTVESETLRVTGIRCERCVMRLGGALGDLDGLQEARATLTGDVLLRWDADRLDRATIVAALARAGFHARE